MVHDTLVLGHRGASAAAKENTLAAYALAVKQNADGIELDVRRTKDDRIVLHHDPVVASVGAIVDQEFAALRKAAPYIPSLDEMLDVTGDLVLNIEIKNDPHEPDFDVTERLSDQVAEWISVNRLHSRTIVSSFNTSTVARVRTVDPSITTAQLLGPGAPVVDLVPAIAELGNEWVAPHHSALHDDGSNVIGPAHEHGLRVVVWTLDDTRKLERLARGGLDAVITNDPAAAVAALGTG